jgi:hypothetical protein
MENNNISIGGGFISLLTVLFIGLKLTDHIDWSWWWVLSPMWLPFAFIIALIFVIWLIAMIFGK